MPPRAGHFRRGGGRHPDVKSKREDASESAADEKAEKYKDGGKLTMGQRKAMPSSSFALPGKGQDRPERALVPYPINDPSHARNALARASGKPVEAKVRSCGASEVSGHRREVIPAHHAG